MKKGKVKFIAKIIAVLTFVVVICFCGYFSLDKIVIPKNFGNYGIHGVRDLTNVFATLYGAPKESKLVEVGYSDEDLESAVSKLQEAGYKIEDDGTILQENISSFKGDKGLYLSDKELAAVCNALTQSGILAENLPHLNYINTMNINVLEVVITPDENSYDENKNTYNKANIKSIVKINTEDLCEQIAIQMETTEALLNLIIPNTIYFTVDYDIDLTQESENRTTGDIAINGQTSKKSEALINLLIEFIFPEADEMTFEKFTSAIGNVALSGIDELGEFSFSKNNSLNENGILVSE